MTNIESILNASREIAEEAKAAGLTGRHLRKIENRAGMIAATVKRMERRDGGLRIQRVHPTRRGSVTGKQVRDEMEKRMTDRNYILARLQSGRTLSTPEAINLNILRAGARVYELRHRFGYGIVTEIYRGPGGPYAIYSLPKSNENE